MGYMGSRADGRRFIQWVDGNGKQRQETLPEIGRDGRPLTAKGMENEGRRRLSEYEGKALRQRRGLDPLPSESLTMTFGQLFEWWWEQKGKTLRSAMVKPFLEKHLRSTLCPLPLREVTSTRLQRLLADKTGDLAPKSLNHLRGYLFNIFEVARKPGGPWEGRANPVEDVERYKVVPSPKKILQPEEFEPVIDEVPEVWKGAVATALYADQLRPHLEKALKEAPGELVFPKPDGSMQSRKLRLNRMLRAAIARAGLIEGFEHRCRAPHCGWKERRPDSKVPEACPSCGKPSVWAKPIPRHVRFHDTRHSGGTAMVKKAGMAVAQKFLRHSDVRLTIHTYGHLEAEDVREGLEKAFPSTSPKAGTASGLQNGEATDGKPADGLSGTAETASQSPAASGESQEPKPRTCAPRARCAAWARTTCSWAA